MTMNHNSKIKRTVNNVRNEASRPAMATYIEHILPLVDNFLSIEKMHFL